MIEYIKGELADVTPAYAVIEAHGVGYGLNISLNTYSAIQGKKEVRLWAYEAIREDAYVLFGFGTKEGLLRSFARICHCKDRTGRAVRKP